MCSIQLSYGRPPRPLAWIARRGNADHNRRDAESRGRAMTLRRVTAREMKGAHFRYFDIVMTAFVVILVLSNVVGAGKRAAIDLPWIGLWPFGAGILFFPISYVLDDIPDRVYGYARRGAWCGSALRLCFLVVMEWTVVALRPRRLDRQGHYEYVFGLPPHLIDTLPLCRCRDWWAHRLRLAVRLLGRRPAQFLRAGQDEDLDERAHLWTRTIGSTIVGEGRTAWFSIRWLLRHG